MQAVQYSYTLSKLFFTIKRDKYRVFSLFFLSVQLFYPDFNKH